MTAAICANCAAPCHEGDLWCVTRPEGPRDACGPRCAETLDGHTRMYNVLPSGTPLPPITRHVALDGLFGLPPAGNDEEAA